MMRHVGSFNVQTEGFTVSNRNCAKASPNGFKAFSHAVTQL
jgi:hypothetical protein